MTHPRFSGVHTALVTPFRDDKPDLEALTLLIERQIAGGVDGVVPCGTTGESATLSADEQALVIEHTVKVVAGRCQVIAGVGSNNTATAIKLTRKALELGADAGLTITPYYNKPGQEGMYRHFAAIHDAVPELPLVLYNVPGRTGVRLEVDTCMRLAELPGVVALKEATADMTFDGELLAALGDRLTVLSGDDATAFPLWCLGGHGVIAVASNAAPEAMSALWQAFKQGQWESARRMHLSLLPLFRVMFCETNPAPIKSLVSWLEPEIDPACRLPLAPLSAEGAQQVREVAQAVGILSDRAEASLTPAGRITGARP